MSEAGVPGARCIVPGALTPQLISAAGAAAEGAISVDNWTADLDTPANKAFVAAFRAKFNEQPGNVDFLAYTSTKILAGAINAAGTADDVAKVAKAIQSGSWDTPIGTLTFKDNQAVGGSPIMIQVKDGKLVSSR
jgi:branched-chain amino acid transport system substrate-binding protein